MKPTAIIEREGAGYVSFCPELDIASQGDTVEKARDNLQEALGLFSSAHPPMNSTPASRARCTSRRWKSPLGRLRVLSGKEVCEILARHGFTEVRRRGSPVVMQMSSPEGTVTVPVPDHAEIRIEV